MADKILNYTDFDYTTIKADIITLLQNDAVFQDYNFAGSNVNTIIELISAVGDLINFFQNAQANESYISSADLYDNINKLVQLIGYNPGAYKASTVAPTLAATLTILNDDDFFTILKGTEFTVTSSSPDGETITYINTEEFTYIGTAGVNNFTDEIPLIQGVSKLLPTLIGTGEAFQIYEIDDLKAIEEYIEVVVDGEIWTYSANLLRNTDSTSKVFSTRYNKNQKVEVIFGDGVFGLNPIYNSSIVITYVQTLGQDGQIGANEISGLGTDIYLTEAIGGAPYPEAITFTITQTSPSEGDRLPLTVDEVRNYGPKSFRTQDRAVSTPDHNDILLTNLNEFILDSITLNSDEYFDLTGESPSTSGNFYNNIYMYVLPRNGDTISSNLQNNILDTLDDYKMTTLHYILKNIDFRIFNSIITFKRLSTTTRTDAEINTDIELIIKTFFNRTNRKIAEEIKYSSIWDSLLNVSGLSSLTLALSSDLEEGLQYENIQLGLTQFPKLGTLSITANGTGV